MTTPPTRTRTRTRKVDPDEFDVRDEKPPFDEDDEEEAPRPRRRRAARDEEEAVPTTRRKRAPVQDLDEDDAEPDGEEIAIPISRGRDAIKSSRPNADGNLYFRWADDGETQVVKFLDEDPWSYNQHWVTRAGKQSFPCIGKNCPLCEIGAKVTQKIVYTVVNLSLPEPAVQVLEVSPTLNGTLETYDGDKKTGPLPRLYWALSRTKAARSSNSFSQYTYVFTPIKERDLEEDYSIPLDDAEDALEKAEAPEPVQVLGKITRRVLQEIADEAMGDR